MLIPLESCGGVLFYSFVDMDFKQEIKAISSRPSHMSSYTHLLDGMTSRSTLPLELILSVLSIKGLDIIIARHFEQQESSRQTSEEELRLRNDSRKE